jgi:RNA polymerase sigma-70 factor (ECF subfamily)
VVGRDAEPFDDFYRREYRRVVALAYVLSGSRAGAEDLAQEGFLAAHRNWSHVDRPGAWVRRVVANQAVSTRRRRQAEARALSRAGARPPAGPALLAGDAAEFWRIVRGLPDRQAQAVALHYLEDWPIAEIALVLDCAEGTVKVHLHKARRALARQLGVESEEALA